MKAKTVPEGTKTLEDERRESLEALDEDVPTADEELEAVRHIPVEVYVRRGFKDGTLSLEREEVEDEQLKVRPFISEAAEVGLSRGLTINLGNYESVRLDVSIKVPCYLEEAREAFEFARRFTEERLEEEKAMVVRGRAQERRAQKENPF